MVHKEFETAGKTPGLQVWRVEKKDIKPVPPCNYGEFFTGDSYLVLYTSRSTPPAHNIHIWHGSKATADEKGCAAFFMTQLDEFFGCSPVQYSEFQGDESAAFLGYFKKGIEYKKGGVASGFNHVVTNEANVKRLLQAKGRRAIRAVEVDLSWNSFNKGDCFIIELGKNIYLWTGSGSSNLQRQKSSELAIETQKKRQGAKLQQIQEGQEPKEVIDELGPKPELPDCDSEDDADGENTNKASLYLISDASGSMKVTKIAEKNPFDQKKLKQNDCYILDNGGDREVLIWKGRDANEDERKAAYAAAEKFIKEKNYSPKTKIVVLPEGAETMQFKQFFHNWQDKDKTKGQGEAYCRTAKVKQIPFDAASLHDNNLMAAQHGMVDDGSGKVQIWRVEEGDKAPVDPSTYGQFYGGDCYLVLYSYNTGGKEKHIIYTWQGLKCSEDEKVDLDKLTKKLADSMKGVATQVHVTQGKEPPHFVSIFKGKPLVIYSGGTSREHGQSEPADTRLFHIRLSCSEKTRAVEVDPTAPSLNTNDVFVLKTLDDLFIWKGKGSTSEEMKAAKYVAELLGGTAQEVEETEETDCFWKALGGKTEYQTSITLEEDIWPPRLFVCSYRNEKLNAEEVLGDLTQSDLVPDDIMILDIFDQVYVWIGKEANETEKEYGPKIAKDYIKKDPFDRAGTPIIIMKQGEELPCFTGWFQAWDDKLWD